MTEFEEYYLNSTPAHWNFTEAPNIEDDNLVFASEALLGHGPLFLKPGDEVRNGAEYLTLLRQSFPYLTEDSSLGRTFARSAVHLRGKIDDIKHSRYDNEALNGLEDRYNLARLSEILWHTGLNYEKDIAPVILVSSGQLHLTSLYYYMVNLPYLYGSVILNHMDVIASYLVQKSSESNLDSRFLLNVTHLMAYANEFNGNTEARNYWLECCANFTGNNSLMKANAKVITLGMKFESFWYKLSTVISFKDKSITDLNLLKIILTLDRTDTNEKVISALNADKNLLALAKLEYDLRNSS